MKNFIKIFVILFCLSLGVTTINSMNVYALSMGDEDQLLSNAQKRLKTLEATKNLSQAQKAELQLLKEAVPAAQYGKTDKLTTWQSQYGKKSGKGSINDVFANIDKMQNNKETQAATTNNNSYSNSNYSASNNASTTWQQPVYVKNGWVTEEGRFRLYLNGVPFANQPPNEHGWASDANGWGYQVAQQPVQPTQTYQVAANASNNTVSSISNKITKDDLPEFINDEGYFEGEVFSVASTVGTNAWKSASVDFEYEVEFDDSWQSSGKYWFVNKEIEAGSGKGVWAEWQPGQWYFVTETVPVSYTNDRGNEKTITGAYAIVDYFQEEFAVIDGYLYQFNEHSYCPNKKPALSNVKFNRSGKVTSGYSVPHDEEDTIIVVDNSNYNNGYSGGGTFTNNTVPLYPTNTTVTSTNPKTELNNLLNQLIGMSTNYENRKDNMRNLIMQAINEVDKVSDVPIQYQTK